MRNWPLARLEFAENELEQMKMDLEKILAFVGRINGLNLEDVEPLIYMNKEVDKLRTDEAVLEFTKEDALKNTETGTVIISVCPESSKQIKNAPQMCCSASWPVAHRPTRIAQYSLCWRNK